MGSKTQTLDEFLETSTPTEVQSKQTLDEFLAPETKPVVVPTPPKPQSNQTPSLANNPTLPFLGGVNFRSKTESLRYEVVPPKEPVQPTTISAPGYEPIKPPTMSAADTGLVTWGKNALMDTLDFLGFTSPEERKAKATVQYIDEHRPPTISAAHGEGETLFEGVLRNLGVPQDKLQKSSEYAKAQAVVQKMANDRGVPLSQYRYSPELIEQASSAFINNASLGIVPLVRKTLTGEETVPPTSTSGYVGNALGSLTGLIAGPFPIAKEITTPVLGAYGVKAYRNANVVTRILKDSLAQSVMLGTGMGLAQTGEALDQTTFTASAGKILEGVKSGALTGAAFGVARGMFPGADIQQLGARLMIGLIALNAQRAIETGGNPFANRSLGDVLFDTGLDVFFLMDGLPNEKVKKVTKQVEDLVTKKDTLNQKVAQAQSIVDPVVRQSTIDSLKAEGLTLDQATGELVKDITTTIDAKKKTKKAAKVAAPVEEVKPVESTTPLKEPQTLDEFINTQIPSSKELSDYWPLNPEQISIHKKEVDTALAGLDLKDEVHIASVEPSPFDLDKETIDYNTKVYENNPSVAANMREALNADPTLTRDVGATTWKLINDVNRWKQGEEVDIDHTREFLSEIASHADQFSSQFIQGSGVFDAQGFGEWKGLVSDAADWARKADRTNFARTNIAPEIPPGTPDGIQVTGAELDEVAKALGKNVDDVEVADVVRYREGKTTEPTLPQTTEPTRTPEQQAELDKLISEQAGELAEEKPTKKNTRSTYSFSLYSGIPITKAKEILSGNFKKESDAEVGMKDIKIRETTSEWKKDLTRAVLDRSGNIRKDFLDKLGNVGYDIVQKMSLTKGSSARATNVFRQYEKESFKGLSHKEEDIFYKVDLATRMIAIGKYKTEKQFAFPKGRTPAESTVYLNNLVSEEGISPERAEVIKKVVDIGQEHIKKALKDLYEEGELISEGEYKELSSHYYRRLENVSKAPTIASLIDKKVDVSLGGKKISIYDSGIEHLQKGHETDILERNSRVMALEFFNRVYGRIENNKANLALRDLAINQPDNPFVRRMRYNVVERESAPTNRTGIMESLGIKMEQQKLNDKDIRVKIKEIFSKKITPKRLTIAELQQLSKSIDPKDYLKSRVEGDKIPKGWSKIFVYKDGRRENLFISPEMSQEWLTSSKDMTPRLSRFLRYASLSPITRLFATGIDWSFALANLPRDIMQIWFAARTFDNGKWSSVYNPVLPIYAYEMGSDMAKVFTDALFRRGRYDKLMNAGMGMDWLVKQGRPFKKGMHLESGLDKVLDALGYPGETSELLTRLAIGERVVRKKAAKLGISIEEAWNNKQVVQKAAFTARDYMDFATGGWLTKSIDNGIPYLNAGVVGMRGFARAFKPGSGTAAESTLKIAQFAAGVVGLYLAAKNNAPKTMAAMKNSPSSQNNLIWPMGDQFDYEDEKGNIRHWIIKVPLDQNLRFFKKLFEAFTDKWLGEDVDAKGTAMSLSSLSPVGFTSLPPSMSAAWGYWTNQNSWTNDKIWKGNEDKSWDYQLPTWLTGAQQGGSQEEFNKNTPQVAKDFGAATGMSPERTRYLIGQLISNSMWADFAGAGYEKAFGGLPKELKEQHLAEVLSKNPVLKRFSGVVSDFAQYGEANESAQSESSIKKFIQDRGLDSLVTGYLYDKNVKRSEVYDYIDKDPITKKVRDDADYDRLEKDFQFQEDTKGMPDRYLWLGLKRLNTDARAKRYLEEMKKDPAKIQKGEDWLTSREPKSGFGIFTKDFDDEVDKLRWKK